MNLSPLYKIICQHYICWWIIHEGSWRVSTTSESWRRQSWQTHRFYSWTGSQERKWRIYWKKSWFENDMQSLVFALKATYSHRHEGSLNEDAGSFELYWIVIIGSSEMISELVCQGLCFLYPLIILQTISVTNLHFSTALLKLKSIYLMILHSQDVGLN